MQYSLTKLTRQEFDELMCRKFPLLFCERNMSMMETCMCWGFEIGTGWQPLVYELASKLEPLIEKWIEENPNNKENHCRCVQCKEKIAGLRFYLEQNVTDEMSNLESEYESKSYHICKNCGCEGTCESDFGWWRTECEYCRLERQKENKKQHKLSQTLKYKIKNKLFWRWWRIKYKIKKFFGIYKKYDRT